VLGFLWMDAQTAPYRFSSADAVPERPVAIVLGASVYRSGKPSEMLRSRLDVALGLYRAGKVKKLLLTGDHRPGYDEITPMRRHVLAGGVPPRDVFTDVAGFTTFESMARARAVFGVEAAIVVTQAFHLPRAIYLARGLGIDAVGLEADRPNTRPSLMLLGRETLARVRAVADLHRGRKPRILGPTINIMGDGRVSWPGREPAPRRDGGQGT